MREFHLEPIYLFKRHSVGKIARCAGLVAVALVLSATAVRAQTFSTPLDISSTSSAQDAQPQVVASSDGNTVYVVWMSESSANNIIYFNKSTDGGSTFGSPVQVASSTVYAGDAQFAVDSNGYIDVVWVNNGVGNGDIFFARSTDGGTNFSEPVNISNTSSNSSTPKLAVESGGSVDVVWNENMAGSDGIMFKRGTVPDTGSGFAFGTAETIATPTTEPYQSFEKPEIAVDSNDTIHVVWYDASEGTGNAYYSSGTLNGEGDVTFSAPLALITPGEDVYIGVYSVKLALDAENNVNVAWRGDGGIYFRHKDYGSSTFDTALQVVTDTGYNDPFEISAGPGGKVDIAWPENIATNPPPSIMNIFVAHSTDYGESFSTGVNVSNSDYRASELRLAVDSQGNVNVMWLNELEEGTDVFFSRSTDGTNFSTPVNISNTSGIYTGPGDMALDSSGNVYLVWGDSLTPSAPRDTYFSLGTLGEPFESFDAKLKIINGPPPGFGLQASASLAAGSPAIDLQTQDVTITIGGVSIVIPADSWEMLQKGNKSGSYVFSGVTSGDVTVNAQIVVLSDTEYQIKVNATGESLGTLTLFENPVTVGVTVGQTTGTDSVDAKFK